MRNMPDVALTADNVFVVPMAASSYRWRHELRVAVVGGFHGLGQPAGRHVGKPSVGFLAPAVYAHRQNRQLYDYFHDTTTGDNTWDQSPTNFLPFPAMTFAPVWARPTGKR